MTENKVDTRACHAVGTKPFVPERIGGSRLRPKKIRKAFGEELLAFIWGKFSGGCRGESANSECAQRKLACLGSQTHSNRATPGVRLAAQPQPEKQLAAQKR
ncbi:MAG: hypothetical protein C5B58_08305 [Acidobacteria bacterium]|nr:MAG: hypothetical protein C5B58_08305 [Acidobacteriota bacterium]